MERVGLGIFTQQVVGRVFVGIEFLDGGIRFQFRNGLADFKGRGPLCNGIADRDRGAERERTGHTEPDRTVEVGENTAPGAADSHRDHRHIHVGRQHFFINGGELAHDPVVGGSSFREYAHNIALPQRILHQFKHLTDAFVLAGGGHFDEAGQTRQPAQTRFLEIFFLHQEAHPAGGAGTDQDRIDEGRVVRQQQGGTPFRDLFRAFRIDFVEDLTQRDQQETQREVRQTPHGEEGDDRCEESQRQHQSLRQNCRRTGNKIIHPCRKFCRIFRQTDHQPEEQTIHQHQRNAVEKIQHRHGGSTVFRSKTLQEERADRNNEKPRTHTRKEETDDLSPVQLELHIAHNARDRDQKGGTRSFSVHARDQKCRRTGCTEGHKTKLDFFLAELAGKQTTCKETDQRRKTQHSHILCIQIFQRVLRKEAQQDQKCRAEPEEQRLRHHSQHLPLAAEQFMEPVLQRRTHGINQRAVLLHHRCGMGDTHARRKTAQSHEKRQKQNVVVSDLITDVHHGDRNNTSR